VRTLICGFLRAGSTAVLKMVEAAGIPVLVDDYDRFLYTPVRDFRYGGQWPPDTDDRAVKVLEPHLYVPPMGQYRAIWIDRDPTQQAKSQIKFAAMKAIKMPVSHEQLVRNILRDRAAAMNVLRNATAYMESLELPSNMLEIRFEDLIEHPKDMAADICQWLQQGDPAVVAAVIQRRKSDCLPWVKAAKPVLT
jgi:hypothetical protein